MANWNVTVQDAPEVQIKIDNCPRAFEIAQALAKTLAKTCPGSRVEIREEGRTTARETWIGRVEECVEVRRG